MKRPDGIEALRLVEWEGGVSGAYPSLGFKAVADAELGNGDAYGLYWPYGREDADPVVCDLLHDEWRLELAFSSVSVFRRYLDRNGGERGDLEVEDRALASARFLAVKRLLRDQPLEAAAQLAALCDHFPEAAAYWYALAGQRRRLGDAEGCTRAAIRAFASNWAFGMPRQGTLRLLRNAAQRGLSPEDPLVRYSAELALDFGGRKRNDVYDVLQTCIEGYLDTDDVLLGLLLNQNYGYRMAMETRSFQERYGFERVRWLEQHSKRCSIHLGDTRRTIA
ncbi:MAG: hypothetical protein AAF624_03615 [Bacteroidota bacterium]